MTLWGRIVVAWDYFRRGVYLVRTRASIFGIQALLVL